MWHPRSRSGTRHLLGAASLSAVLLAGSIVLSPSVAAGPVGPPVVPQGPPPALEGVACPSASTCIAVGGPGGIRASHNRGRTWSRVAVPTKHFLSGVTCPTTSRCLAVGDGGTALLTTDDGRVWKSLRTGVTVPLSGVDCPVRQRCVAVGDGDTVVVSHDGGRHWRRVSVGLGVLDGVACSSPVRCTAVTSSATENLSTDDGTRWTSTPVPFSVLDGLQAMNGIACHGPLCVSVGARGLVAVSSDGGAGWSIAPPVTAADLQAVSCPSAARCVAVGSAGTVLRTDDGGATWEGEGAPTGQALLGVDCTGTEDCVAVGSGGTVLTSSDAGVRWSKVAGRPVPAVAVRLLVVGDSLAHTLAMGLAANASAYGVTVIDGSLDGCALARGSPVLLGPTPYPVSGPCAPTGPGWPAQYQSDVGSDQPDLSLLVLGPWDLSTRLVDGTWQTPGQAGFDSYYLQQILTAVSILSAGGGRVALATLPDVRPSTPQPCSPPPAASPDCPTEPERVTALDNLARWVAAASAGRVTLIDLLGKLDPRNTFESTIDGVVVRAADGVHLSPPGGEWLTPWLLPALIAAAR